MPKASSAAPVMTLSVAPAKTPRVSARAAAAPVARDTAMTVVTLRVLGVAGASVASGGTVGWRSVLMVVSLSQWDGALLSSVAANAIAHAGQMAGM